MDQTCAELNKSDFGKAAVRVEQLLIYLTNLYMCRTIVVLFAVCATVCSAETTSVIVQLFTSSCLPSRGSDTTVGILLPKTATLTKELDLQGRNQNSSGGFTPIGNLTNLPNWPVKRDFPGEMTLHGFFVSNRDLNLERHIKVTAEWTGASAGDASAVFSISNKCGGAYEQVLGGFAKVGEDNWNFPTHILVAEDNANWTDQLPYLVIQPTARKTGGHAWNGANSINYHSANARWVRVTT